MNITAEFLSHLETGLLENIVLKNREMHLHNQLKSTLKQQG